MKLPQLHLRDLFWLVLVCGLVLGWWLERSSLIAENEGFRERYLRLWPTSPGQRLEVVIDENGCQTATLTGPRVDNVELESQTP